MSRHDRVEGAAALLGLAATAALLIPAALTPARDLRAIFGSGLLERVPVMALAALWFLVVLVVRARRTNVDPDGERRIATYLLFPAMFSLALVVQQGRSLRSLAALPTATAIVYLGVVAIAVSSALRETVPLLELPRHLRHDLARARPRTWAAGLAALAVAGASFLIVPPGSDRPVWHSVAEFEQWYAKQPRLPVPVDGVTAPVVIVKFHDYQCPPCRRTFDDHRELVAAYGKASPAQVAYVVRDYPLDVECNPPVRASLHPLACEAAAAVRLAARKGRDEAMAAWLYEHQTSLSRESIVAAAREVAGVDDFEATYAGALEQVKADVALGNRLGVRGTPTFFVNGVRMNAVPRAYLEAAVAYELRQGKAAPAATADLGRPGAR
jgi:protein-disulfide isomerase